MRATIMFGAGDVQVEEVPHGYRAMNERKATKVLVEVSS
jgi:hypothetical protein